jgi:hypothetical protein
MGASTGNRVNMDAARRQQAMEGRAMRRRAHSTTRTSTRRRRSK